MANNIDYYQQGNMITYDNRGLTYIRKPRKFAGITWGVKTEKYKPSSNWKRLSTGEYVRELDDGTHEYAPEGLKIFDKGLGKTAVIGDDYRAKRYLVTRGTTPKSVTSVSKKDSNGGGGTKARVAIKKPKSTNIVLPGFTKPDDITDIQAFLRDYLSSDLKRYGADGIWGAETLAAYNKWIANNKANRATLINSVKPRTTISDTSFDKPIDWTRNSFKPTFKLPERPLQHITDIYFGNSYLPSILRLLRTPKIETTVPKIPAVLATLYVLSEIPSLATPSYVPTLDFNRPNFI